MSSILSRVQREIKKGRHSTALIRTSNMKLSTAMAIVLGMLIALVNVETARAVPQPRLSSSSSTESASMEAEIHSIIQQARDAWVNGDADAFAALFTSDGEFLVPGNRWVGPEAIRQVAADFAANSASVTVEIRRIIVEGNQAAVEWYWEDTDSSGRHNQADDVIVVDFVDGKISRWREYIDTQTPQAE